MLVQIPQHGLVCKLFPACSAHTLSWDYKHSSTNLQGGHTVTPPGLFCLCPPTHLLANPTSSSQARCGHLLQSVLFPQATPKPGECWVLRDDADCPGWCSFLCRSVSQSVGLFRCREEVWVVSLSSRLALAYHMSRALRRYMRTQQKPGCFSLKSHCAPGWCGSVD